LKRIHQSDFYSYTLIDSLIDKNSFPLFLFDISETTGNADTFVVLVLGLSFGTIAAFYASLDTRNSVQLHPLASGLAGVAAGLKLLARWAGVSALGYVVPPRFDVLFRFFAFLVILLQRGTEAVGNVGFVTSGDIEYAIVERRCLGYVTTLEHIRHQDLADLLRTFPGAWWYLGIGAGTFHRLVTRPFHHPTIAKFDGVFGQRAIGFGEIVFWITVEVSQ